MSDLGDGELDFSFEFDVNSMNKDTSDEYAETVPPAAAAPVAEDAAEEGA